MDTKELYLFGVLLALADEQSEAISKHAKGKLGWWGKSRIIPRGREIHKGIMMIIEHKTSKGLDGTASIQNLVEDIIEIKKGNFPKKYPEDCFEILQNHLNEILS